MVSFQDFKYFYVLFFLFGQAPYYPLNNRTRIKEKTLMSLPFIILVFNFVWCSLIFCTNKDIQINFHNNITFSVLKYIGFTPNIFVIYVNLTDPYSVCTMNKKLFLICDYMKIKMKIKFNLNKLRLKYLQDFFICLIVISITHIWRITFKTVFSRNIEIIIFIMKIYVMMSFLHALFYVHFFKFILTSTIDGMKSKNCGAIIMSQIILKAECIRSNRQLTNYVKQIRFVHLKLWQIIRIFNRQFGFCIIAIFLDLMIATTNALYTEFTIYSNLGIRFSLFRKYILFNYYNQLNSFN